MSKIKFNNIPLEVSTNGVTPGQLTMVDEGQAWLAREAIVGSRFNDDALTFEVVTLTGKRHRLAYVTGAPTIPVNNDAALAQLYKRYLQTAYDINGEGLSKAQAQVIYSIYSATQVIWAQKAQLAAKINDPDVSLAVKQSLITAYNSTSFSSVMHTLELYGTTINVFFAEGSSCQFTDWVIADFTDFRFNFISRTLL